MSFDRSSGSRYVKAVAGALVAALLLLAGGYLWFFEYIPPVDFVARPDGTAKLIDGIESCAPVDVVVRQFEARGLHFTLETNSGSRPGEGRPPLDITALTVQDFAHLGEHGTLAVEFFNDRLSAARFYPVDAERYRRQLLAHEGLRLDELHREAMPAPHTRVWIAVDLAGREYVGWEDRRLARQMKIWIKRYS